MTRYLILLFGLLCGQTLAQPLPEAVARGKAVYDANCSTCHGPDGKGAAAGVKALDGSAVVLYDTARQLRILLDGVSAKGMPSWAKLGDAQLADVVTYTKNQWGNATGVIMAPSAVSAARLRGDGCVDQFFSPLPHPAGTSRVIEVVSPAGKVNVWWCLLPARQGDVADKLYWRMQGYPVHKDDASKLVLVAAAGRIAIAADPIAQAWAEVSAARIAVVPGSQKEYEYRQLAWLGCEKLRVTPLPNGTVFDTALAADYCGPAPKAPPQPSLRYVTAGSGSVFTSSAGVLGRVLTGRTVPAGTAGDCATTRIVSGTSLYCSFAGARSTAEVTFVKVAP